MTLPTSGAISLSEVDVELGDSGTSDISMNDPDARSLAGVPGSGTPISMSDFYGKSSVPPFAGTWVTSASTLPAARSGAAGTLLSDDRLVVLCGTPTTSGSAETNTVYLGTTSGTAVTWATGTSVPMSSTYPAATTLSDGRVVHCGGYSWNTFTGVSNLYIGTVSGNTIAWATGTALPAIRYGHAMVTLQDGRIACIAGAGSAGNSVFNTVYLGTVSGNTVSWVTGTAMPGAVYNHRATILNDGRIISIGGLNSSSVAQASVYIGTVSGNTISWVTSTALPAARHSASAIVVADGRVIVAGGSSGGTTVYSTVYIGTVTGDTISWATGTALPGNKRIQTSYLAADNKVFLVAGDNGSAPVNTIFVGS